MDLEHLKHGDGAIRWMRKLERQEWIRSWNGNCKWNEGSLASLMILQECPADNVRDC